MAIDPTLQEVLYEIYNALDADLRVLSAIGVRTAFDHATAALGIDTALRLNQKLDALVTGNRISAADRALLSVSIDAGSAAAHRAWRPSHAELATMMDIIEAFILRSFILPARSHELRQSVPSRGKQKPRP